MAIETQERANARLTEVCWPVFEFLIHFNRQLKYGAVAAPEQVRFEALTAIRDAEEAARDEPTTERCWNDRVKGMMVYLIDYKMLNTDWAGRDYWFDHRFETDPEVLNHAGSEGGDKFFEDCDELQKEYEQAERRDRRDKDELAEQLGLYFTCLRLGFKGHFHDRPQELADYTRRLWSRLPAYASTRAKEMFPDAYRHNQELKVDYKLGLRLVVVLAVFAFIIVVWMGLSRLAWDSAVGEIRSAADDMRKGVAASAPSKAGG